MFGHIILTITTTILNLNPSFVHTQNIWSHLWERNGGGQRERERESSTALLHDLSRPDGVGAKEQMPSSFVKSAITHTTPNHPNHHPIKPCNPPSPSSNPIDPIPHNPTPKTHIKPDPQSPNKWQALDRHCHQNLAFMSNGNLLSLSLLGMTIFFFSIFFNL